MTHLQMLALTLTALLHPGAEVWAHNTILTTATIVAADREPLLGTEEELALALTWEHEESDFGRALAGKRWDLRAFGVLQIRDKPWLERDPGTSVRVWLGMLHEGARRCGPVRALAMISSGRCDAAVRFADQRTARALAALAEARKRLPDAGEPAGE